MVSLVRTVTESNDVHDSEISMARAAAEQDALKSSEDLMQDWDRLSARQKGDVSGISTSVQVQTNAIEVFRNDYSMQTAGIQKEAQATLHQRYMDLPTNSTMSQQSQQLECIGKLLLSLYHNQVSWSLEILAKKRNQQKKKKQPQQQQKKKRQPKQHLDHTEIDDGDSGRYEYRCHAHLEEYDWMSLKDLLEHNRLQHANDQFQCGCCKNRFAVKSEVHKTKRQCFDWKNACEHYQQGVGPKATLRHKKA